MNFDDHDWIIAMQISKAKLYVVCVDAELRSLSKEVDDSENAMQNVNYPGIKSVWAA